MKTLSSYLLASALIALGLVVPAKAQQASPFDAQLTLTPVAGTSSTNGSSLTYDINISNLQTSANEPQALGAYDIFIDFDPSIVSVAGETINSTPLNVGGDGDAPFTSLTPGQVELSDVSLDFNPADFSSQATSFTIGTVTFTGIGTGTSDLTFDAFTSLSDQNANLIVFGATGSTISSVVATPEPSSIGLGLLAGAVFVAFAFRRRSASV